MNSSKHASKKETDKLLIIFFIIIIISFGMFSFVSVRDSHRTVAVNEKRTAEVDNQVHISTTNVIKPLMQNAPVMSERDLADEQYLSTLPIKPVKTGTIRVPVLLYHHIADLPDSTTEKSYYVTPKIFEEQMTWLSQNNYKVVSLTRLVSFLNGGADVFSEKSVAISFDDGTLGQYTDAFPVLKKYGFTASFFVVPTWANEASSKFKSGYMNWDQLKDLKNNGMEIGSHALSHKDLAASTDEEIVSQLSESKNILEEKFPTSIDLLAFPGGSYNESVTQKLKVIGYLGAFSVEKRIDHLSTEVYHIGRMHIDDDMPYFKARVMGKYFK